MTLQGLLALEPKVEGFVPVSFRESVGANSSLTATVFFEDVGVLIAEESFDHFCQEPLAISSSIPQVVHFIWLGSEPPPTVHFAMASWKKYHPTWEIKLWTNGEVDCFPWSSARSEFFFHQADNWAEKSDILRFEILYQFGGIYSDTDAICLKSFEELVTRGLSFFACFEENKVKQLGRPLIGSAVMGAAKYHSVLKRAMDFSQTKEEAPDVPQHLRSGPGPISRACYEALETEKEDILILPCSYFYPFPWAKRLASLEEIIENIRPESFAIHLWEGSWFEL